MKNIFHGADRKMVAAFHHQIVIAVVRKHSRKKIMALKDVDIEDFHRYKRNVSGKDKNME